MGPEVLLPTLPSLLGARNAPFVHRDLSWLQFNERVLAESRLAANPLLERCKFLAITQSNLDEFFMIRFSSLNRSISNASKSDLKLEKRLIRIRQNILDAVAKFVNRQKETLQHLSVELAQSDIHMVRGAAKDTPEYALGKKIFLDQIFPLLGPFQPYALQQLSGLENLQWGVYLHPEYWMPLPKNLPTVIVHPTAKSSALHVFFLDDLIQSHLAEAFGFNRGQLGILRLTRDGDLSVEISDVDSESIPDLVRTSIRTREKGRPARLQWSGNIPPQILQKALHLFRFEPGQIISSQNTMSLSGLWTLYQQVPEKHPAKTPLKFPSLHSHTLREFKRTEKMFERLQTRDFLLHHPYDSFDNYVAFIREACADSKVEQIDLTVYRVDALSPVIDALKGAAKKKRIRVVIELRARFDELNNLQLADDLRKVGVQVSFGFGKLKLHAKLTLVTRIENDGPRYYSHLSTGNYNAATARQYTDLAIISGNQEIGLDVKQFFDSVTARKEPSTFKHLVSAPSRLHRKLMSLIQAEVEAAKAGKKAKIFAKMNALVDEAIVAQLYEASQAGVQIDLVVRGACSLIPGVKGLSENIRVVSIVDRFLEHSRIYYFENSKSLYLSSADWMPRNFFSRLEIAFPVLDSRIYQYLEEVLIPIYLLDTVKARELVPQGTWRKRSVAQLRIGDKVALPLILEKKNVNAQNVFEELSQNGYQGTPLFNSQKPASPS